MISEIPLRLQLCKDFWVIFSKLRVLGWDHFLIVAWIGGVNITNYEFRVKEFVDFENLFPNDILPLHSNEMLVQISQIFCFIFLRKTKSTPNFNDSPVILNTFERA